MPCCFCSPSGPSNCCPRSQQFTNSTSQVPSSCWTVHHLGPDMCLLFTLLASQMPPAVTEVHHLSLTSAFFSPSGPNCTCCPQSHHFLLTSKVPVVRHLDLTSAFCSPFGPNSRATRSHNSSIPATLSPAVLRPLVAPARAHPSAVWHTPGC